MASDHAQISIDFGTSFSKGCIANSVDGLGTIIELGREVRSLIPSVLYVPESGEIRVGDDAELQALLDPQGIARHLASSLERTDKIVRNRRSFEVRGLVSEMFKFIRIESQRHYDCESYEKCNLLISSVHTIQETETLVAAAKLGGYRNIEPLFSSIAALKYWLHDSHWETSLKNVLVVDLGSGSVKFSAVEKSNEGLQLSPWFAPFQLPGVNRIDGMIWQSLTEGEHLPEIPSQQIPGIRRQLRQVKEAFSRNKRAVELLNLHSTAVEVPRTLVEMCFSQYFEETFSGVSEIYNKLSQHGPGSEPSMVLVGGGGEIESVERYIQDAGWKGKIEVPRQPQFAAVLGAGLEDQSATKRCPEDGSLQPKNAKICAKCGYPFWKFEKEGFAEEVVPKTCPEAECGFENDYDQSNCKKCGCPLS